jgi:hypothetical protein
MRIQSLLIGAAVAAIVVLPARAADANWVNGSWQTYQTHKLKLDNIVGNVKVDVKDSGPMVIRVSGLSDRVKAVHVQASHDTLTVASDEIDTVWDWRNWFKFSDGYHMKPDQLVIHIAVPRGSAVDVDASGNMTIGSTNGPLRFEVAGFTNSTVGDVSEAHLSMAGSGKLTVGNVAGKANIETAGNGNIRIGNAGKVKADIAGSGSIAVGNIQSSVNVDIAGSGDFSAASVNGPTSVDIAGSGSVTIAGGEANPLHVDIMGSGSVSFGGVAVNPRISSMGSGSVKIKSYRGTLDNDGMGKISIGG